MNMKPICTALGAVLIAGAAAIPVLAYQSSYMTSECVSSGICKGLKVETDGTVLTEEMVRHLEGYQSLSYWEVYIHDHDIQCCPADEEIAISSDCFMIELDTDNTDTLSLLGRRLMLDLEGIESVSYVSYSNYVDVLITYEEPNYSYETEYDEVGNPIDATMPIMETSKEYLAGGGKTTTAAHSVWSNAGDCHSDGSIDAQDAAVLLGKAAEIGTGAEIKITARLDVNADGEVDASDASAILLHAAQAGAGKLPNWVEIVQ